LTGRGISVWVNCVKVVCKVAVWDLVKAQRKLTKLGREWGYVFEIGIGLGYFTERLLRIEIRKG